MMSTPAIQELTLLHSNICKALGDPKRILLLYALHEQPRHVNALAELLDVPQPTVSRHLSILRRSALVRPERHGATVVYTLVDPVIIDVLDDMRGILRRAMTRHAEWVA